MNAEGQSDLSRVLCAANPAFRMGLIEGSACTRIILFRFHSFSALKGAL